VEARGKLKQDDVVIVPDFFGKEDDWSLYYQLIKEMAELQEKAGGSGGGGNGGKGGGKGGKKGKGNDPAWISWHEGAHLITKNPQSSKTFQVESSAPPGRDMRFRGHWAGIGSCAG